MSKYTSINLDTNQFHDYIDELYESLCDDELDESVTILGSIIKKARTMITLIKQNLI